MATAIDNASRFDHLHGDEDQVLDVERFDAQALDDVIETIMLYAQYPAPRRTWDRNYLTPRRVEFDLAEWLEEHYQHELAGMAAALITLYADDSFDHKMRHEKAIEAGLRAHLADSQIVRDRAESMAQEARDE